MRIQEVVTLTVVGDADVFFRHYASAHRLEVRHKVKSTGMGLEGQARGKPLVAIAAVLAAKAGDEHKEVSVVWLSNPKPDQGWKWSQTPDGAEHDGLPDAEAILNHGAPYGSTDTGHEIFQNTWPKQLYPFHAR